MKPFNYRLLFWTLVGTAIATLVVLVLLNPTNTAQTSLDAPDPHLRSRQYPSEDLKTVAGIVEEVIPSLSTYGQPWRVVSNQLGADGVHTIQAEVPVLIFTDDLQVWLRSDQSPSAVVVNIHSSSRLGQSDLGENRRHILQLLQVLDIRLGQEE